MNQGKRRLFLSHASEDKDTFARPLAHRLKCNHDVWFDEFSLRVGDSIFQSISRGLQQCDFGVVVLSRSFFEKKWTQNELNALFALESALHRIILPVWLNVVHADVLNFSAILADRKAVLASRGVEAVASALELAIESSIETRTQEQGLTALERAASLSEKVGEEERSKLALDKASGVRLVRDDVKRLFEQLGSEVERLQQGAEELRVRIKSGSEMPGIRYANIYSLNNLFLRLEGRQFGGNFASRDEVRVAVYRYDPDDDWNNKPRQPLHELVCTPFIARDDKIYWRNEVASFTSKQLIEHGLNELITAVREDLGFE
jgi:hypothetical protein